MIKKLYTGKDFLEGMARSYETDYPPKRKKPWLAKDFNEMEAVHEGSLAEIVPDPNPDPSDPSTPNGCLEIIVTNLILYGTPANYALVAQLKAALEAKKAELKAKGEPFCQQLNITLLSCLQVNDLCYCISCGSIFSDIAESCEQPMDEECQTMVCDNPDEPCPEFTLVGGDTAPATICPSTPICAADVSGGTVVD